MEREAFVASIVGYAGLSISEAEEDSALAFAEGQTGLALDAVLSTTTVQYRGYRNRYLRDLTFQQCQKKAIDFAFKGASHNQVFENYNRLLELLDKEWATIRTDLKLATSGSSGGYFSQIKPGFKYGTSGRPL